MSIYERYCKEIRDESGRLVRFELDAPKSFNFGYDVLDVLAEESPDKTALVWCDGEGRERILSFAEVREESNRMANVLQRAGIGKGSHVMVTLKRHVEYWFAAIALHKLGAVMIPMTHMLTVKDLEYRLNACEVSAILATPESGVPGKFLEALENTGKTAVLWCVREGAEGFRSMERETREARTDFERVETKISDPMLLYFTSGTTGNPKGVIHDHSYPLAHVVTAKYWQGAFDGGLHFTVAETGWAKASWGKLYGQWLVGSAVMVYDFDAFDPKGLVRVINRYKVTSFCAPPTVYRYLVRKSFPEMPSLLHASTAGETLAPEVFRKFTEKTGLVLREGYGQTETTLLAANFIGDEPVAGSMGTPSPFYQIELRDANNSRVSAGEIGEVVVVPRERGRIPGVFSGYLEDPERYARVWRDGVYHTGDAAVSDESGRLFFHGRFDDLIKTGGFRVGPAEIESALMEHPDVAEVSVIGVPDELRGQAIKAFVVLDEKTEPSARLAVSIREFCNKRLAEYKWVREIEFVETMPKTISGKIRKSEQREESAGRG